jgi:transposase
MMLSLISELYVSTNPTDFRKSYDGLAGVVRQELQRQPSDGALYVFFNKRRDQIKILAYANGGYCLWQKRLEQGTFAALSPSEHNAYVVLSPAELLMIIEGISLRTQEKKRLRYSQKAA